jgi:hypothetical protein
MLPDALLPVETGLAHIFMLIIVQAAYGGCHPIVPGGCQHNTTDVHETSSCTMQTPVLILTNLNDRYRHHCLPCCPCPASAGQGPRDTPLNAHTVLINFLFGLQLAKYCILCHHLKRSRHEQHTGADTRLVSCRDMTQMNRNHHVLYSWYSPYHIFMVGN